MELLGPENSKDEGWESWDYLKTGIWKKKIFTKWGLGKLFSKSEGEEMEDDTWLQRLPAKGGYASRERAGVGPG